MTSFWNATTIEPKRAYRWVADINLQTVDGNEVGPSRFLVSTFTKPTFTLDNESIINNFTSETEIVIKNYSWDDISMTMIDLENDEYNVSSGLYSWLTSLGYQPRQNTENIGKLFTNLYSGKMNITLSHIDPWGQTLESWKFIDPQPTSIDFGGELSYGSDEIMTVTMGVTYVAAEYELNRGAKRTVEFALESVGLGGLGIEGFIP
tara:strand:+ start:3401 stop:4018 length:618 start_codon:yes stop_codon:yes gene_type:complete